MSWAGGLVLLLMAAGAPLQQAAADDAIALDIPDCAGVSGATVRGLVELEVAPRPVLGVDVAGAPVATRGVLECEDGLARIRVEDAGRPEPLRLDIELSRHAPAARPRLLALAIAELIATSRLQRPQPSAVELDAAVSDESPPSAAADPVVETSVAIDQAASFQLWLALAAVREAEPAVLAPSIALGGVQTWDQLAIVADIRYERGQRTEPEVRLGMDVVSLALGPAWRVHGRSYQLLLGPSLRAGYAALRASARTAGVAGDSVAGLWFGPCLQLALQFRVARRWAVRLGGEGGYVARGVRGLGVAGEALFEVGGAWASAQLGVSFDVVGPPE